MENSYINNKEWKMGTEEVAKFSEPTSATGASQFRMYIPKLMPLVSFGNPLQVPVVLNPTIFINDPSCKPAPSQQIVTQNYITIPRTLRGSFKLIKIGQGQEIKVEVLNGNEDTIRLKNDVDPQRETEEGARDSTIHSNVGRIGVNEKDIKTLFQKVESLESRI